MLYRTKPLVTNCQCPSSLRHIILFCALILVMVAADGCTTVQPSLQEVDRSDHISGPVWPPPPQLSKIRFVASFYGATEFERKKSWFQKVFGTIFGEEEQEDRLLLRPYGIAEARGILYVTDPGSRVIHIFDMKNKADSTIRSARDEDFVSPIGIAVDKQGDIFVTDSILRKVFVFDGKGRFLREIGHPNMFVRPSGIAVSDNKVYVVDTHAHRVMVFDREGHHLFNFGQDGVLKGQFHYPTHIWIDRSNRLYITDSLNFRVQIFDESGKFISSFGKHGDGSGDFASPKGIAADSDGHVYVADAEFDNIQIFDTTGRLLLSFGESGRGKGQLILPTGLFIDDQDRIYVADSYNNRIQIFQYLKAKEK